MFVVEAPASMDRTVGVDVVDDFVDFADVVDATESVQVNNDKHCFIECLEFYYK